MSNIEEDIKVLENYLKHSSYKEKENDFFKGSGWEVVDLDIPQAMANVLAEREADKKRIKELEEALLKVKDKNIKLFINSKNSIPKQKVKDKMEKLNKEIKSCDEIEAIFKIKQQQILQELLEDK